MQQPVLDLFGQVVITHDEIDRWLESVPRLTPGTARTAWYARAYDVPGKIARAKLEGSFEQLTQRAERPTWYWQRFAWR